MIGQLVGTGVQLGAAFLGNEAANRAAAAEARLNDIRAQQERLTQVRQSRIKAAQVEQAGANQGASDSSGVQGGAGSIRTQANSNITYINAQQGYGEAISQAKQDQAMWGGVADIGKGISSASETFQKPAWQDFTKSVFG